MSRIGGVLLVCASTVGSCKGESRAAPVSLPLGKWCISGGAVVDSSFAVAQARDALTGRYLSGEYEPLGVEHTAQGILVSLGSRSVGKSISLGGGGLVWVDGETGCAIVLKHYE